MVLALPLLAVKN